MKKLILFGAGLYGELTVALYSKDYTVEIDCFVDNDSKKWGNTFCGYNIISPRELLKKYSQEEFEIIITTDLVKRREISNQLDSFGISTYGYFNDGLLYNKQRLLSFASEYEDVILFHVLQKENGIFWIDVGCMDPMVSSVTNLFYLNGGSGINIDVQEEMINLCKKMRPRDINLNVAVGDKEGRRTYSVQGPFGALTTMRETNLIMGSGVETKEVEVTTLARICDDYVGSEKRISFLKIDVEGMEKEVLLGSDFVKYRPYVVVIESTLPMTNIPNYQEWEDILLNQNYHHTYSYGVNRYYVADERNDLDVYFEPWIDISSKYFIENVRPLYF